MNIITKQDKANTAAERWKQTYYRYNTNYKTKAWFIGSSNDSETTYNKLLALGDKPSPKDIDSTIDNSSWTRLECDCCDKEVNTVVQFEYGNTNLCKECVTKLALLLKIIPT